MKVVLYMAITANGMIAGDNDDVGFVTKASWKSYLARIKQTGCVALGRRTYELMPATEFLDGCTYVVFSHSGLDKKSPNVIFTSDDPKKALKLLEKKGIKQICLCGGGHINASFMKAGLIDEIYIDVEPALLGRGIGLFEGGDFEAQLKLLGTKKLSKNEIQLHYKVLR